MGDTGVGIAADAYSERGLNVYKYSGNIPAYAGYFDAVGQGIAGFAVGLYASASAAGGINENAYGIISTASSQYGKAYTGYFNGGDVVIVNGGKLGVGTTHPDAYLDVRGDAVFNDNGGPSDFRIESENMPNIFKIDADKDQIQIGEPHNGVSAGVIFTLATNGNSPLEAISCSNTKWHSGFLNFLKARGTITSKAAVQKGDNLGQIKSYGYDGGKWSPAAQIVIQADDIPVSSSYTPGRINFATTEDGTGLKRRMTIKSNGNVGIGTATPTEKLDVEGDLEMNSNNISHYYGFPRPNYDSGWTSITQDSSHTFTHNIGGNTDNYVVDMQFRYSDTNPEPHQTFYGGFLSPYGWLGCYWEFLTNTEITVTRREDDTVAHQVRIRIWVYN